MQTKNISSKIQFNLFEKNVFCKNKTKISLPDKYYMSFPNNSEVLYILVSIKLHIGTDMDKGQYVCYVLDYNTGTWWNCDDEKITQYPGYPMNVCNDLSFYNKQRKGKNKYGWIR